MIAALELVTEAPKYSPEEIAAANVRFLLVEQGAQLGFRYGWVSEAARRVGMTQTMALRLLRGLNATLRSPSVRDIAKYLGRPPSDLYRYRRRAFELDFSLTAIGPDGEPWQGSRRQKERQQRSR